jgi:hypothetical protein
LTRCGQAKPGRAFGSTTIGIGDEILALGQAKRLGRRVQILDKAGNRRWHDLWEAAPYIARLGEPGDFPGILNGPGCRPYIDYRRTTKDRWAFTAWRASPGELRGITPDGRARGLVLLEPHIKPTASPNKDWGWHHWQQLVHTWPDIPWAQVGNPGVRWLDGVQRIETRSFREACALLAACATAVLPEGALHHASAALGRRVVVLFGGYISPRTTGYPSHINLAVDDPEALGWRLRHPACSRAWSRITPDTVATAVASALQTPS